VIVSSRPSGGTRSPQPIVEDALQRATGIDLDGGAEAAVLEAQRTGDALRLHPRHAGRLAARRARVSIARRS